MCVSGCRTHSGRRRHRYTTTGRAFTLVEVVIVIIILGIIAAIAVPRLSRGTEGSADAALQQDLAVMQRALEHYAAEHGRYPDADKVVRQLTGYTDANGAVSPSNARAVPYVYGPYLREVPAAPAGPNRGSRTLAAAAGPGVGWVYDSAKGAITLNKAGAATVPADEREGGAVAPADSPVAPVQP